MGKRKQKEPAMGTSLVDILFQKNLKCEDVAEQDVRVAELQQENSTLAERNRIIEEQCETLELSNKTLLEELHLLDKKIKKVQNDKTSVATVLFERAIHELKNGKFIYVLGLLQAVLIHEPENIKAMINLSVVYAELGFHDMATETLQGVLEKDPHNDIALRNMIALSDEF